MDSEAFVQLALNSQQCSQKELATRLGVSPAQISKWKKGEHMSKEMEARLPLRAELLNLAYESNDEVGSEAEAESLGLNASRIHPDIYMNELLVGMRVIHQVLPAILKKLGMDGEFELDTSKLRLD